MNEVAISLMVLANVRRNGYVDVPPSGITPEIYDELILSGYSVGRSDRLWMDGWCVYSPRAVRAGLFRAHIPQSIYTRVASLGVRVPYLEEIEEISEADLPVEDLNAMRDKSHLD